MEGEGSTGQVLHDSNRLDNGDGSFPIKKLKAEGEQRSTSVRGEEGYHYKVEWRRVFCRAIDKYTGLDASMGIAFWDLLC